MEKSSKENSKKIIVLADVSMLKEENIAEGASGFVCHAWKESEAKASCLHEDVCYALGISTVAVSSTPSNPVDCYVKKPVLLPNKGKD